MCDRSSIVKAVYCFIIEISYGFLYEIHHSSDSIRNASILALTL